MLKYFVILAFVVLLVGCGENPLDGSKDSLGNHTEDQETEVIIEMEPSWKYTVSRPSLLTVTVMAGPQDETVLVRKDLTITWTHTVYGTTLIVVNGTLMVPAGKQRVFILEAKESNGDILTGVATLDLIAGMTETLIWYY